MYLLLKFSDVWASYSSVRKSKYYSVRPWKYRDFHPIYASRVISSGENMRISLVDSRTNGFKKWSDAQRPAEPPAAPEVHKPQAQKSAPTAAGPEYRADWE